MKIRTRLLLFLLPPLLALFFLIASILFYSWYEEMIEGFRARLRSAIVSCSALINKDQLLKKQQENLLSKENFPFFNKAFHQIQKQLDITDFFFVRIRDQNIPDISCPFHIYALSSLSQDRLKEIHATLEQKLPLLRKKVHITQIYKNKIGHKVITGYAPIRDIEGNIIGVLGADVSIAHLDKKIHKSLWIFILGGGFSLLLIISFLFLIANKIAHPVQKLSNSALAIAGGNYGDKILVKGPREIVELSHTLNTLSECLNENINRLKENSIRRERMYGEYECAMLLQNHMLQKVIDECQSDIIDIKAISFFSKIPKGFLLDIFEHDRSPSFSLHVAEAMEKGFEDMYHLLTNYKLFKDKQRQKLNKKFPHAHLHFDFSTHSMSFMSNQFLYPFIWSTEKKCLLTEKKSPLTMTTGDYFFLSSSGLVTFFEGAKPIEELLIKVLKFFAIDGLEICTSMLQKELSLATKRKELVTDIHLLCFQLLY